VLLGGHSTDKQTSRLRVDFDVLNPWAAPRPIVERCADKTITADVDTTILQEASYEDFAVRLLAMAEGKWGQDIHLDRRTFFEIEGSEIPLSELFRSWVRPIHDLLIVCLGRQVSVMEVRVELNVEYDPSAVPRDVYASRPT
jgi:hypothetical protein